MARLRFRVVCGERGEHCDAPHALALRQMRRVLKHGGRLALSVWNSPGLYNSAVGEALARYISNETSVQFLSSRRQAPTREELQHLATEAGFSGVEVRVSGINIHLPHLDQFTLGHLGATPFAAVIAAVHPTTSKQLGPSVMKQLQRYADGDGVTYPEETHLLTAQVS